MEELVTIVAPCYNHEMYVENAIISVSMQTYKNKELIIIDDCSKDNSYEKVLELVKKQWIKEAFPGGIKVIKNQTNSGAHYSINKGLKMAKGKYLTIINTDDMYQDNRLEVIINEMKKNDALIAFSSVDTIDNEGNILRNEEWGYYKSLQGKIDKYPFINLCLITDNIAISTGNLVFTKNLFEIVGEFENYKYIHDWDFILRATLITEPIFIKTTSYLYRLHGTNSFRELKKDEELCQNETIQVLTSFFKRILREEYSNFYLSNCDVWDYFIKYIISNEFILKIWEITKQKYL